MVGLDLRDREKKFKDGRHVGLDFYDLLIEAFTNAVRIGGQWTICGCRTMADSSVHFPKTPSNVHKSSAIPVERVPL